MSNAIFHNLCSNKYYIEIYPDHNWVNKVEFLNVPKVHYFERFMDHQNLLLIQENYLLQERVYGGDNISGWYEVTLIQFFVESREIKTWRNINEINEILKLQFHINFNDITKCISASNVFEYFFKDLVNYKNGKLILSLYDCSNVKDRSEHIIFEFDTEESLNKFVIENKKNIENSSTRLFSNKIIKCSDNQKYYGLVPEDFKIKFQKLICPDPDTSFLDVFME